MSFVGMFETSRPLLTNLNVLSYVIRNFASVIRNLLSFSAHTFRFEVFFTNTQKNITSQVFVDGCKVSVVRLREVSVLQGVNYSKMTKIRPGPTLKVSVKEMSVL